ncbi:FlgO family outer membrane protein [Fibrobacterota bacterium]
MNRFTLLLALLITSSFAVQKELGQLFSDLAVKDVFKGRKVIAVMPFKVGENIPADAGRTVSEFAVVNLAGSGRYQVVERQEFANMLAEQELAQSDLVDEDAQINLGKMLVADRLVVGTVTESFGKRMINARILKVETGEVISTASTTVGPASMDDFMKELLGEKGQVSASLFRSMVVPGWGQMYTNHPIRGTISILAFLGAAGYTAFTWFQVLDAKSDKDENINFWNLDGPHADANARAAAGEDYTTVMDEHRAERDRLYSEYDEAFTNNVVWLCVTGGVWALNLVDATFAGLSAKKKFDLYFSFNRQNNFKAELAYRF